MDDKDGPPPHDLLSGVESKVVEGLCDNVEILCWMRPGCRSPNHFSFVIDDEVEAPKKDGCFEGPGGITTNHLELGDKSVKNT